MAHFLLNIYLLTFLLPTKAVAFAEWKDVKDPTLEELSCQFFSLESGKFKIKEHSSPADLAESGLGDPVFIVVDKKNKPIGVIKTISTDSQDGRRSFKSEFESLDFLNHLPLKKFHTIKLKGIAETTVHGEKTGLIAEEFAHGYSLNVYLKKIATTLSNKERKKLLSELNKGVEKTAIALAELHKFKMYSHPAHNYLIKFDSDRPPGPYGLIHGDTHPGNIFYDSKTDTLTFIDFGSSHIDREGAPVLQDASNFLLTLEIFAAYYHLTSSEISSLTTTFLTFYQAEIPAASDNALAFYKSYYIKAFANPVGWDPEQSSQAKFINNYCNQELLTFTTSEKQTEVLAITLSRA